MHNESFGLKEIYDVNLRLNQPITIGKKSFETNETILSFEKAEIVQLNESKVYHSSTGGYNDNLLIEWEVDKEVTFSISNGVMSPISWAILSNSQIIQKHNQSIPYKEIINIAEFETDWRGLLKFSPNNTGEKIGIQGNPDFEALPMGRKPWLPLKPLPPKRDRFIFCYDMDTGKRIKDFEICGNQIFFNTEYRQVMVDYTFDYLGNSIALDAGRRLFNGFLNLSGKMTIKDYATGEPKTAILEIPRLKIQSTMKMLMGMGANSPVVSDFYFVGYPEEGRNCKGNTVFTLSILEDELSGGYI